MKRAEICRAISSHYEALAGLLEVKEGRMFTTEEWRAWKQAAGDHMTTIENLREQLGVIVTLDPAPAEGALFLNDSGRWEIRYPERVGRRRYELTSGDVVEVFHGYWIRTRIESRDGRYYAVSGVELYVGIPAREVAT